MRIDGGCVALVSSCRCLTCPTLGKQTEFGTWTCWCCSVRQPRLCLEREWHHFSCWLTLLINYTAVVSLFLTKIVGYFHRKFICTAAVNNNNNNLSTLLGEWLSLWVDCATLGVALLRLTPRYKLMAVLSSPAHVQAANVTLNTGQVFSHAGTLLGWQENLGPEPWVLNFVMPCQVTAAHKNTKSCVFLSQKIYHVVTHFNHQGTYWLTGPPKSFLNSCLGLQQFGPGLRFICQSWLELIMYWSLW